MTTVCHLHECRCECAMAGGQDLGLLVFNHLVESGDGIRLPGSQAEAFTL